MSHSSHIFHRFHHDDDDDDDGLPLCRLNILNFLYHYFVTLVLVELQILNPEFCYSDLS
jgi:hypothetical protein